MLNAKRSTKLFILAILSMGLLACNQGDAQTAPSSTSANNQVAQTTDSAVKNTTENAVADQSNDVVVSAQDSVETAVEKAKAAIKTKQPTKASNSLSSLGNFVAGKDYEKLSTPISVANNGKIEVVEFFWYGCGHCYSFEPLLSSWKKSLADDVDFKPTPAVWAKPMDAHAKMYYSIKAMGVEDKLHMPIFRAMNEQRKRMASLDEIAAFVKGQGVDEEKFRKTYKAFGINSQVQQGVAKGRAAGMRGTPELLVHGKYRVTGAMAGSQARMLTITNYLIEKERQGL